MKASLKVRLARLEHEAIQQKKQVNTYSEEHDEALRAAIEEFETRDFNPQDRQMLAAFRLWIDVKFAPLHCSFKEKRAAERLFDSLSGAQMAIFVYPAQKIVDLWQKDKFPEWDPDTLFRLEFYRRMISDVQTRLYIDVATSLVPAGQRRYFLDPDNSRTFEAVDRSDPSRKFRVITHCLLEDSKRPLLKRARALTDRHRDRHPEEKRGWLVLDTISYSDNPLEAESQ